MTIKSAVILLNGPDFNRTEFDRICTEDIFLIAADGGIRHIEGSGVTVDLHAGDFDSSDFDFSKVTVKNRVRFPAEKDESDFTVCLEAARGKGFEHITVFGATGGRTDHFLSNYDTAVSYAERGMKLKFIGISEDIYFTNGPEEFNFPEGSTVSVYSGTELTSNVSFKGFKYEIKNRDIHRLFPSGLSNIAIEKKQFIDFKKGVLVVIYNKLAV
jgi:thiamine pyrophosphokinase